MQAEFDRLKACLKTHWPEGYAALNPPVTEAELQSLETTLGFPVPAELKALLSIHNGQDHRVAGVLYGWEFLSAADIGDQWLIWKGLLDNGTFEGVHSEPDEGIKNDWWNPKWIPLTSSGSGDHHCFDIAPDLGGASGQIISMWHDGAEREHLAPSLSRWLIQFTDGITSGDYIYADEYEAIVPKEDVI